MAGRTVWRRADAPFREQGTSSMFGIDDTFVWMAYLLCILSALLCVIYGALNWNRGEETIEQEDIQWASEEKKIEEEI